MPRAALLSAAFCPLALVARRFAIEGVHNHMTDEQPRVFFVH